MPLYHLFLCIYTEIPTFPVPHSNRFMHLETQRFKTRGSGAAFSVCWVAGSWRAACLDLHMCGHNCRPLGGLHVCGMEQTGWSGAGL